MTTRTTDWRLGSAAIKRSQSRGLPDRPRTSSSDQTRAKPREQSWSPVALPLPPAVFTRFPAFARYRAAFSEGSAPGLGGARGGCDPAKLLSYRLSYRRAEGSHHGLRSCIARQQAAAAGSSPPAPLPASCWRYCTSSPSIACNMPAPAAPSRAIVGPSRALLRQHKWRGCREGLLIRVRSAIRLDEAPQAAKARSAIRQRRTK